MTAEQKEKMIASIIAGRKLVKVGIINLSYPQYISSLYRVDTFLGREIMEEAVKRILKKEGINYPLGSVTEFLQKLHGKNIFRSNEVPSFAISPRAVKKNLIRNYGRDFEGEFKPVTQFSVKLKDIMKKFIEEKKSEIKKEEKKEIKKEEKEVKIVKKFRNGSDFGAIVECEGKTFRCSNIFDYGLVVVEIDENGKKIETEEGEKLKKYLEKNSPIYSGIRM